MSIVAGIDVGSRSTKAILVDQSGRIVGSSETETGAFLAEAAERAFDQALSNAGMERDDVAYVASTGWGRYQVAFRHIQITDITCHARGAVHLFPGTRTVLDIGAQNTRAIRVEANGRVKSFRMNNRCAAGAGRFLERVARAMELDLESIGPVALRSQAKTPISSVCAVLAESEVINLVSHEARVEDILAGVHDSLTDRIVSLVRQMGTVEPEITLTGGVSRNVGMVHSLEARLDVRLNISPEAEYAGALGAALLGHLRMAKRAVGTGFVPALGQPQAWPLQQAS